jgi:hypothetical protein
MKGTFRAKNVVRKLREAYEGLLNPCWTPAAVAMVRWHAKNRFRWFHGSDVRDVNHRNRPVNPV